MLKKASGGGIIVGALCVLKMLYAYFQAVIFTMLFYTLLIMLWDLL
jgi:hypothetical protein